MVIGVICVIVGVLLGFAVNVHVSAVLSVYIAIGLLACIDSIFGGIVANINKNFNLAVFITGFFGNALLSIAIIYLGTRLGLDLYTGVVFVFIFRIFQNFAIIRRFLLNKWEQSAKIKKEEKNKSENKGDNN